MSNLKVIRKTLVSGTASGYSFAETGAKFLVKNFSDNDCYVAVSSDEVNTKSVCVPSKKAFILLSNEFKPEGIDTLYILGEGEVEVRMLLTYVRVGDKKQTLLSGASYFMDITSDSEGGATVVANPTDEATADLTKLKVDTTIYGIPQGTEVEANPTLSGNEDALVGLKIGDTNYAVQPVSVQATTTAPSSANTDGGLKLVILTSDPATKYEGYIYYIVGSST